jgi:solute carrier family 35 protein F1/2
MSDATIIHSSPVVQDEVVTKKSWKNYFEFIKDRNFWKVLLLGQCKFR